MRRVVRAGFDPRLQRRDFARRDLLRDRRVRRRHLPIRIGRDDALVKFALEQVPGLDGFGDARGGVEAELALARGLVGTVAVHALVRQNRPDLAIEIRRGCRTARFNVETQNREKD